MAPNSYNQIGNWKSISMRIKLPKFIKVVSRTKSCLEIKSVDGWNDELKTSPNANFVKRRRFVKKVKCFCTGLGAGLAWVASQRVPITFNISDIGSPTTNVTVTNTNTNSPTISQSQTANNAATNTNNDNDNISQTNQQTVTNTNTNTNPNIVCNCSCNNNVCTCNCG